MVVVLHVLFVQKDLANVLWVQEIAVKLAMELKFAVIVHVLTHANLPEDVQPAMVHVVLLKNQIVVVVLVVVLLNAAVVLVVEMEVSAVMVHVFHLVHRVVVQDSTNVALLSLVVVR